MRRGEEKVTGNVCLNEIQGMGAGVISPKQRQNPAKQAFPRRKATDNINKGDKRKVEKTVV